MSDKIHSATVKEAIEYFKLDKVPSMKELNTMYRQHALKVHPDKNGNSDKAKEEFQILEHNFKVLCDYILAQDVTNGVSNV